MEEKILIKSERYSIGKGLLIFFIIVAIIGTISAIGTYSSELKEAKEDFADCYCGEDYYDLCYEHEYYDSPADKAWDHSDNDIKTIFTCIVIIGIVCALIYAWMRSYEMVVTDKRVYGKAAFGKRVDLPMDSVSAIGSKILKGIAVSTSSGKVSFLVIKNRDEIHKCVSDLLIDRQNRKDSAQTIVSVPATQSTTDELKKFKDLLDMGVITQEEFDAKKKQLLGL